MNLKLLAPPSFDRVKYMQHAAFLKLVAANASPNETSLRFEEWQLARICCNQFTWNSLVELLRLAIHGLRHTFSCFMSAWYYYGILRYSSGKTPLVAMNTIILPCQYNSEHSFKRTHNHGARGTAERNTRKAYIGIEHIVISSQSGQLGSLGATVQDSDLGHRLQDGHCHILYVFRSLCTVSWRVFEHPLGPAALLQLNPTSF